MKYILTLLLTTFLIVILFVYVREKNLDTLPASKERAMIVLEPIERNAIDLQFLSTLKK